MNGVAVYPSPIEGLGLFATRPFWAGERIRRVNIVREITEDNPCAKTSANASSTAASPMVRCSFGVSGPLCESQL